MALPPARLKPESNQYLIGSSQFLRRTPILLTGYATGLSTRTSLSLTSRTSKCSIWVWKLEHSSSAHELLKIKQEDTDSAISLAKTGSVGKEHRADWVAGVLPFPRGPSESPRAAVWSQWPRESGYAARAGIASAGECCCGGDREWKGGEGKGGDRK